MLNVKKNPEFKTRCLVYTDSGRFQFDSSYKERGARFVLGLNKSIVQTKNNDNGIRLLFFLVISLRGCSVWLCIIHSDSSMH